MMQFLLLLLIFAQPDLEEINSALSLAERRYDAAAVELVLDDLESVSPSDRDGAWHALQVRGLLLVAELRRMEFEKLPESAAKERRDIGKMIDLHAEIGLAAAARLPESSEVYRYKADLIGTMIRSNYRAGKMKGDMKAAIDAALRLDPGNAKAMVSRAKMLIFNPSVSRSDLDEAVAVLEQAIGIEASLEQATLLMARAWELLGNREKSLEIWAGCLRENPDCAPARDALQGKVAGSP